MATLLRPGELIILMTSMLHYTWTGALCKTFPQTGVSMNSLVLCKICFLTAFITDRDMPEYTMSIDKGCLKSYCLKFLRFFIFFA